MSGLGSAGAAAGGLADGDIDGDGDVDAEDLTKWGDPPNGGRQGSDTLPGHEPGAEDLPNPEDHV